MRALFGGILVSLLLSGAALPFQGKDARAEIGRLQKRIELLTGDEVKREIDPGALAASLAHDPERIFGVVRDLEFHPYGGALRGALGSLLAGAANDVDRCLLLKDLLERAPAKPAVRFAFGELTDGQAAALVVRALAGVPARSSVLPSGDEGLLATAGETEESLIAADEASLKTAGTHLRRVSRGFAEDRASLEASLKAAGVALSGIESDGVPARARALRDHVWLQVERDAKWVDLDPSFPAAEPGWAPVPAARTEAILPAELYHRVNVRLSVERHDGKAFETETLFSGGRATAEMGGRSIQVTVAPAGFDVARFTQSLEQQAAKFERFQAVVTLGGVRENARVFDIHGKVFQSKDGKFASDSGEVAGNRVFGALTKKPQTTFSALRLEIQVVSPGAPGQTAVRALMDRIQPGTRDGGQPQWDPAWKDDLRFRVGLFQAWSIWPALGPLNDAFFVDRLAAMLARQGGVPALLLDQAERKRAVTAAELADRIDPLPLGLIGVIQSAMLLSQGELEPGEGLVFPERPSILIWKEAVVPGKKNEAFWRGGIDLARAPLGVLARNPADAARARFVHGLLLTEGESSLMEDRKGTVISAAIRFRRAREAKVPLLVLRGELKGVELEARAKALVAEDLRAGRVVVLPKEPSEIGGRKGTAWWRLDPASGECLGVGETGEGQAVSEGVLILDNISIPMVDRCMKFVVCLNVGVGMNGASMQDAGRECMMDFMEDFVKDTLNSAINQFVPEKFRDPAGHYKKEAKAAGERMMKDIVDPEYYKLYEKAKKCYGTAQRAKDLGGYRKRVELLLKMGNDIAKYAHEKAEEGRRNR